MYKLVVLVDAQNDFITGILGSDAAVNTKQNIIRYLKTLDDTDAVILTKDTHDDNYLNTKEGIKLPVAHCLRKTQGWDIDPDILYALKECAAPCVEIYEKDTFGSWMLGKHLEEYIMYDADYPVYEIIFMGFCTDICVVSNALVVNSCIGKHHEISVKADCCAGTSPERHQAALEVMGSCQINII